MGATTRTAGARQGGGGGGRGGGEAGHIEHGIPKRGRVRLPEAVVQTDCRPSREHEAPRAAPTPARKRGEGSGWGGTRTPTDDFVEQRRKSLFLTRAGAPALPPRVYVDSRTLIREVTDLCALRRGDHCLVAINLVRCAHPVVDYAISCLGSIEICYLYHHFIIVDDVDHIDEMGVPRNAAGKPAMIFECGNTVPEAVAEIVATVFGRGPSAGSAASSGGGHGHLHERAARLVRQLLHLPLFCARFILFFKAKFTMHPLADYGDTPHIYIVLDKMSPEERERAVAQAQVLEKQHEQYHVIFNNCEHMCNLICRGAHKSGMIGFGVWAVFRVMLGLVGLLALRLNQDLIDFADMCYDDYCLDNPRLALAAYHLFTTVPVALQAMISYILLMHSVCKQHGEALIDRHECYHLLAKEFSRSVIVGGVTIVAISLTPQVVSGTCLRFVVCAFAYTATDMVYNCAAHAVMRLVLLPTWGRVWFLGSPGPAAARPSSPTTAAPAAAPRARAKAE